MKANPYQFRAFVQAVQTGSFTAAAAQMGVTQSAVTQHVGKLERMVGAKLLSRGANGLELTQAGRDLFDLADRYATLTQEVEEHLAGYADFAQGQLSIIANAPQPAMANIARYGRIYPDVELNFTLFDWTRTMTMLADHSVDIAFVTRPRMLDDCVYKKVCQTHYVLYVPRDHEFASRGHVSLSDLAGQTLLMPEGGSLTQRIVVQALSDCGIRPRRRVNTTTFPVMKEAILMGVGVGIFLANATPAHDMLVQLPIVELTDSFEIYAAVPRQKFGLRLIKSFWDEIQFDPAPI